MTTPVQSSTTNSVLSSLQSAATKTASTAPDSSDQFLKMLVAQLKNQDPLNPMDNAQVTSQMAQLSTVDGINKLNATLSTMSMGVNATQALQAASLVGSQVLVDGNTIQLTGGKAAAGYSLDSPADKVTVTIKSASGEVVYNGQLGAQAAGMSVFNWDGTATNGAKAVDGAYSFTVSASQNGAAVPVSSLTLGRVDAVAPSATGASLTLGGVGTVPLANVKQIL